MFKKYYCIKQHDGTDCAAACLATISRQYGLKIPIAQIREIAGTDRQGTNVYGIIKAAERLAFTAKAVRGGKEAFFSNFPLPCIAYVLIDDSVRHFVVIHKIMDQKVIIADPAKGIVVYSHAEFFKIWQNIFIFLVPSNSFKTENIESTTVEKFFALLLLHKKLIFHVFLLSLLITFCGIVSTFYFKVLMDDILPNDLAGTLQALSIGVLLLYIVKAVLTFLRGHILLYLGQKLDLNIILGYYLHVLKLPLNFFSNRKVGEVISRYNDAFKIRDAISSATLTIMIDTLLAVGGGIVLYMQNAELFGITVAIAFLYGIIVFSFKKPYRNINRKQMENNAELSSYLIESLNGIETVKSFSNEDMVSVKTEFKFIKMLKSLFVGGMLHNVESNISGTVAVIGGMLITWVGAYSVMNGKLSLGQLLTFNALLAYFLDPIKNLINLQSIMQTAIVASDRVGEILDLSPEKSENEDQKVRPDLFGDIHIKNLDFRYGARALVLNDIHMEILKGEKIALVGESGSGKTTLAKLLLNFYPIEKGEIIINGSNLQDINLEYLRGKVAYISQDIFLYSGTVLENLRFGAQDATIEEVIEVCKRAYAHDFINELPLRYDTKLAENGNDLSGGQKQRLAIVRALLRKPNILIMDEATSNLDSITEKAIEKTITENTENITTVIIAHRLSTIMNCDRIFVLDKGRIVEEGSHNKLMSQKGIYYSLWKNQMPEEIKGE